MELFAKIVKGLKAVNYFPSKKKTVLDLWLGPEYAFGVKLVIV